MTDEEYKERVQNERELDRFHRCEMRCFHDLIVELLELSRQLFCERQPSLQESEHRLHLYERFHTALEKEP